MSAGIQSTSTPGLSALGVPSLHEPMYKANRTIGDSAQTSQGPYALEDARLGSNASAGTPPRQSGIGVEKGGTEYQLALQPDEVKPQIQRILQKAIENVKAVGGNLPPNVEVRYLTEKQAMKINASGGNFDAWVEPGRDPNIVNVNIDNLYDNKVGDLEALMTHELMHMASGKFFPFLDTWPLKQGPSSHIWFHSDPRLSTDGEGTANAIEVLREGFAEYFMRKAIPGHTKSHGYDRELMWAERLVGAVGEDVVKKAFFGADKHAFDKIVRAALPMAAFSQFEHGVKDGRIDPTQPPKNFLELHAMRLQFEYSRGERSPLTDRVVRVLVERYGSAEAIEQPSSIDAAQRVISALQLAVHGRIEDQVLLSSHRRDIYEQDALWLMDQYQFGAASQTKEFKELAGLVEAELIRRFGSSAALEGSGVDAIDRVVGALKSVVNNFRKRVWPPQNVYKPR